MFDERWSAGTGPGRPAWVRLPSERLQTARNWMSTPTYPEEHAFLAAHPELLEEDADGSVEEALLAVTEQGADRLRALREMARAES